MSAFAFKIIGTIGLASYAVAVISTKLRFVSYQRFKVVAVRGDGLPAMPRGYAWRVLDPDELRHHAIDVGPEVQRERFAEGFECLAVFDRNDALVGVTWLARGSRDDRHFRVRFELPPGAAWDTGLWVPAEKRMTRAFSAVWAAVGDWLRREGLDCTMSTIADYNVASIAAHRRLGARELRTIAVIRCGPIQLTFGGAPFLRLGKRSRWPRLALPMPGGRGDRGRAADTGGARPAGLLAIAAALPAGLLADL